jgi:hypothetical protein
VVGLREAPALLRLDLSHNGVSSAGAAALALVVQVSPPPPARAHAATLRLGPAATLSPTLPQDTVALETLSLAWNAIRGSAPFPCGRWSH